MRLSLWQQFSSNHSANFTVVGTFESAEKANHAATELRLILARIEKWWDALSPEKRMEWHDKDETSELTPLEIELSQQYKVNWPFSINWYHWASWDHKHDPVSVFQRFVMIGNPHPYIYCGPQPFDELVARFGGVVALEVFESLTHPDEGLMIDVVCRLPSDDEAATLLYESFNEDFTVYKNEDVLYSYDIYKANIHFPFNIDFTRAIFPPNTPVYEVRREGDLLHLHGLNITETNQLSEVFPKFVEYLIQEDCTDIQFSFRSSPLLGWRKDQEES